MADTRKFPIQANETLLAVVCGRRKTRGICTVSGCERKQQARGYCTRHLQLYYKHGNTSQLRASPGEPARWALEVALKHTGVECLTWPFGSRKSGYGTCTYGGRKTGAHRLVCLLANGEPTSPKMEAAHSCGNGHLGCVNPRHLKWATRKQNALEAVTHGVIPTGDKHPMTKISDAECVDLINSRRNGALQKELADRFGISQALVSSILSGAKRKSMQDLSL
jgi:hypothetical protein